MTLRILFSLFLFCSLSGTPAISATIEEEELELQMRAIAKTLRCAVCQNESIWESQAGLARQMQGVIRERLLAGDSPDEVRAYFQSRYGDYILLAPRKTGVNWVLWAGPFVLLGIGGFILYRTLSGWVRESSPEIQKETPVVDGALKKRIREAIDAEEE